MVDSCKSTKFSANLFDGYGKNAFAFFMHTADACAMINALLTLSDI